MVDTFRAAQTTYDTTNFAAGGTRQLDSIMRDLSNYMDAPERADTPFLNSISKGKAGTQRKKEWGVKSVNARGSLVGAGGITNVATTLPVTTGHGVRFQHGHVLWLEQVANPANYEIVWVTADPAASSLTIKRAQGGTTGLAFAANDTIRIIGIAMPQLTDFPLGPLTRGKLWYNWYERFETSVELDIEAINTRSYEEDGDPLDADMATKLSDMKEDLEEAFLVGRRQEGDPNPADPIPAMCSGILHFAELSGNVLNVGGSSTLLSLDHVEEAVSRLDEAVGSKAGSKLLMHRDTKRIFNRLLNNNRQLTATDKKIAQKFDVAQLETGDYTFEHSRRFPKGAILVYDPGTVEYHNYQGMDWQEMDLPVSAPKKARGAFGNFTLSVDTPQTMYLINNFNTTLSAYPSF